MAKKGADAVKIGHYAFIAGLIAAVVVALVPQLRGDPAVWIMVILGVIVGFLNITVKETVPFLVAAIVLIISSSASALTLAAIRLELTAMLGNVIMFVAAAAFIVAIKTVFVLAEK